ncbi:MAG: dTDP-4-dehydrorhamnose 3,5-epimerase family protein [Endomicrobiia bacterium]|nr:dTDP-4-dehydrorhamnose 3,5-epimerase family protein [Endomicrobiia bacterium]
MKKKQGLGALKKLALRKDSRGALFEIMRSDWREFGGFGQTYITVCKPGWVKGWHFHKKQTDNFCVVKGKALVVLADIRSGKSAEYVLSEDAPALLTIPAGTLHGFECLSKKECRILNVPDRLYNYKKPDEYRIQLDDESVPYRKWRNRKGW